MKIAVIDGLGGGLGFQIITNLREELSDSVQIIALGTNSNAAARMLGAGADQGASGENAIRVTTGKVDIIVGPLGIIIPNSMLGEITVGTAEAVADSDARKFLIGNRQPHVNLVGMKEQSINDLIRELTAAIRDYIEETD